MKTNTTLTLATLAARLAQAQPDKLPRDIAMTIVLANKQAKTLRKRWENQCNYEWACTPKYEAATEKLEQRLVKVLTSAGFTQAAANTIDNARAAISPLAFALQADPRGLPVILNIAGNCEYIGF